MVITVMTMEAMRMISETGGGDYGIDSWERLFMNTTLAGTERGYSGAERIIGVGHLGQSYVKMQGGGMRSGRGADVPEINLTQPQKHNPFWPATAATTSSDPCTLFVCWYFWIIGMSISGTFASPSTCVSVNPWLDIKLLPWLSQMHLMTLWCISNPSTDPSIHCYGAILFALCFHAFVFR